MNYDNAQLLFPMSGANGGTSFPDYSINNLAVTVNGDAQTSTAQNKFYTASALFDGTGDYLKIDRIASLNIEDTDFYIGAWCYIKSSANPQVLISMRRTATSNSAGWTFNITPAAFVFQYNSGPFVSYTGGLTLNTWLHLAASRSGTTVRLFVDGTVVQTNSSFSDGTVDTVADVVIGRAGSDLASGYINAHVQDLVLIKGEAVHTGNFTPPGKLITTLSNSGGDVVRDASGSAAARTLVFFPSVAGASAHGSFLTNSSGAGAFSIDVPAATEFSDIASTTGVAIGSGETDIIVADIADDDTAVNFQFGYPNTASVTLTLKDPNNGGAAWASKTGLAVDVSEDRDSLPFYSATGQSTNGSGELSISATNCPLAAGTRTVWIRITDSDGLAGGSGNDSNAFYAPVSVTVA